MVCSSVLVWAQSPEGFNYQAVARNADGTLMQNKSITVKTTLLSGPSASNKVYEETHTVTTNAFGHFSIIVGNGTSSDAFSSITWADAAHHLKVEIDQGSGYVVMGTVQLQSVPYALHSKTAETVTNLSISTADISDVSSTGATTGSVLKWDGSAWVPGSDDGGNSYSQGSGIIIVGSTISARTTDAIWNANQLNDRNIGTTAPKKDEVLTWDGSAWSPAAMSSGGGTYDADGSTLYKTGNTFSAYNTTALWNANKLNGISLSGSSPNNNQLMQYNGTNWGFVDASSLGASKWNATGNKIYYSTGNVGINRSNPNSRLSVYDSLTHSSSGTYILNVNRIVGGKNSTGGFYYAQENRIIGQGGLSQIANVNIVEGDVASSGGEAIGAYTRASGNGAYNIGSFSFTGASATSQSIGYFGEARAKSTFNIGVYSVADMKNTGTNYGVFSVADSGAANYAGYFLGNVTYTGTLAKASDANLKYNVNNIGNATSLIKQLSPKTYYYKQDGNGGMLNLSEGLQYGFIAQELEKVLPEMVINQVHMVDPRSSEKFEYKAVDYTSLIPVLTQAIKEQQEMIELLEQRISELEKDAK